MRSNELELSSRNKWTPFERRVLESAEKKEQTVDDLARNLSGRNSMAIYQRFIAMGLTPPVQGLKKNVGRPSLIKFGEMDIETSRKHLDAFLAPNRETFITRFEALHPGIDFRRSYNFWAHREKYIKILRDRIGRRTVMLESALRPTGAVIHRAPAIRDEETLLSEILNEMKVQTRILEELAGRGR